MNGDRLTLTAESHGDNILCNNCLWLEESILITDMLIHRISQLSHSRENLAMAFGRKTCECDLSKAMNDRFKLTKKLHGFSITSINNPVVKIAA